jgi:hypothetical protein
VVNGHLPLTQGVLGMGQATIELTMTDEEWVGQLSVCPLALVRGFPSPCRSIDNFAELEKVPT